MEPIVALAVLAWLFSLGGKRKHAGSGPSGPGPGPAAPGGPGGGPTRAPQPTGERGPTPREAGVPSVSSGGDEYRLPEDFDTLRGIYFTPDCVAVAEAVGFWNGIQFLPPSFTDAGPINDAGFYRSGLPKTSMNADASAEAETVLETMQLSPTTGAVGFVDYWLGRGETPQDIAMRIIEEFSPMCSSVDPSQWGGGLLRWYDETVDRIIEERDSMIGGDFSP